MLHLIQPRFKNIFGEHYYRFIDSIDSKNVLISLIQLPITFEQNSDLGPAADARLDGGTCLHPPGPRQGQPLPQLHRLVLIRGFRQVREVDPLSS